MILEETRGKFFQNFLWYHVATLVVDFVILQSVYYISGNENKISNILRSPHILHSILFVRTQNTDSLRDNKESLRLKIISPDSSQMLIMESSFLL